MSFANLPKNATLSPTPFRIEIPQDSIDELKSLVKLSKVAKPTFENLQKEKNYGVSREWILEAKRVWSENFDWRKREGFMNSFPQWKVGVGEFDIHFAGLFSEREDAVPIVFLHGWPGSFLEFLPILDNLRKTYTPETLPYHVIVPSLPGFAFSSSTPLDRDFNLVEVASLIDKLMIGLGFGDGYIAQGGDVGSSVARLLGVTSESCKAVHLNFVSLHAFPQGGDTKTLNEREKAGIKRAIEFREFGTGYSTEHATRPSTIGLVLASNPIALLAWIGEKFIEWSDDKPSLEAILEAASLYWLTDTFPSSIYAYRARFLEDRPGDAANPKYFIKKPMGFSSFPKELILCPESWAKMTGNMVFYREHEHGGHFAAMEKPEALMRDMEEFVQQVWKK